jgi:transcriptional regulator with XRE-family HTH domain
MLIAPRHRIDPIEVFTLRSDGWTQQQLADRYGCSKTAVALFLRRSRTRFNHTRPRRTCACGCGRDAGWRLYASLACYYAHLAATAPGGPYVDWSRGQKIARQVVQAAGFALQPGYVVHHVDRDCHHNRLANLWVFASHGDHMSFHRGGSGRPIWRGDGVDLAATFPRPRMAKAGLGPVRDREVA